MNVQAIEEALKAAGPMNIRITPRGDKVVLEVLRGADWCAVSEEITKETASRLLGQTINRTICG